MHVIKYEFIFLILEREREREFKARNLMTSGMKVLFHVNSHV